MADVIDLRRRPRASAPPAAAAPAPRPAPPAAASAPPPPPGALVHSLALILRSAPPDLDPRQVALDLLAPHDRDRARLVWQIARADLERHLLERGLDRPTRARLHRDFAAAVARAGRELRQERQLEELRELDRLRQLEAALTRDLA